MKREKLVQYKEICSRVLSYLYVSGQDVALSKSILRSMGITHVINCAGLTVDNLLPLELQYLKLNMVDGKEEDLLWFVYQVIDFIESARGTCGGL